MSREKSTLRVEDMDPKNEYIKCPDDNCLIFYNTDSHCLDCPYVPKPVLLKKCKFCSGIIELPLDYSTFLYNFEHTCKDSRQTYYIFLSGKILQRGKIWNINLEREILVI